MNNIKSLLEETLISVAKELTAEPLNFSISQNENISFGDYSTNLPLVMSKVLVAAPMEIASKIKTILDDRGHEWISRIEIVSPGFLNVYFSPMVFEDVVTTLSSGIFAKPYKGKKIVVEYTDPNPFKLFHIGHLVPNIIGESIAKSYEELGAEVTRICYQSDVGMHVASALYGALHMGEEYPKEKMLRERIAFFGRAYAYGVEAQTDPEKKQEIVTLNKAIFERSDEKINELYDEGKKWSLEYFDTLYEKLGTKFDYFIMESEVGDAGKKIVIDNTPKVFTESEGAYVYQGEKKGLHTRVFINSQGLPTYEGKELGNTFKKEALVPDADKSLVVTAKEIDEYFKVIHAALEDITPVFKEKLIHISHGMLKLPEGKMSSRKGNIIPAEDLLDEIKTSLTSRFEGNENLKDKDTLLNDIAVGAIKFAILRQALGRDMIFDFEKSLSFDGDSGPYLQYTYARSCAILRKGSELLIEEKASTPLRENEIERLLLVWADVRNQAVTSLSPQLIVSFLLSLAHAFNSFYARQVIVDKENAESGYYLALTHAVNAVLKDGLTMLAIEAPEAM